MRLGDYLWALSLLQNQGHEDPKSLGCLRHPTGHSATPLRVWRSEGLRGIADTENTWPERVCQGIGCTQQGLPTLAEQGPRPHRDSGCWSPPTQAQDQLEKGTEFLPNPGMVSSSSGHEEGAAGAGSLWQVCSGTHRGPWTTEDWGFGAVGTRRHAQVRRATYTYGVVPQDVQLLHQLCDQDVLEAKRQGTRGR